MHEPLNALYLAAFERSKPIVDELRSQGWDVQVVLTAPSESKLVFSLEFHLELARWPIEARTPTPSEERK